MDTPETLRRNILVVDDDRAVLGAVSRILRDRYTVRLAEDAGAALDMVALLRPDLVLLDLHIPGTDGLAILRELTRFDPALKVVMVSGDVRPESISQALAGGAVAYLGKPFSVEEVTDAVDHAMSLSARRPS